MANVFDQFDEGGTAVAEPPKAPNVFDQFDEPQSVPNVFDQFDEPKAKTPNIFDQFDEPATSPSPSGKVALVNQAAPAHSDISGGQRVTATPDIGSDLASGNVLGAAGIAYENVRRHFSGLIGPTESERVANSAPMTDANGNVTYQYKPLGSRLDQEGGLFYSIPESGTHAGRPRRFQTGCCRQGDFNIASGVEGSLLSPGGVATFGTSGTAAKVTGGAFSLDMLSNVKDQIESANKADTTQGKVQGYLGAAVSLAMGGLGLKHAFSTPD
ncbi:MAG: hypothetical protein WDN28_07735 [Chthoniobacter sp.]